MSSRSRSASTAAMNWEKSPSMRHWEDLAWRIQDDTEKVLLERARWLRETTGAKNLCIAGGVALNCVANGRHRARGRFRERLDSAGGGRRRHRDRLRATTAISRCRRSRARTSSTTPISAAPYTRRGGAQDHRPQRLVRLRDEVHAQRGRLPRHRQATRRRQRHRLVPGPLRIRSARARQPQHHRRPAQGRDEGHPEQAREAPAGVPAVRADRAGGARQRRVRGQQRIRPSCCSPCMCGRNGATRFRRSCTSTAQRGCRPCGARRTSGSTSCSRSSTR